MDDGRGLDDALRSTLAAHGAWNAYLFVHGSDGGPAGYPMLATFHDDALEFTTYRRSAKAGRIFADPRVCLVLRNGSDESPLALAAWGEAREVTDGEHLLSRPSTAHGPIEVPASMHATVSDRLEQGKRVVFRAPIDRIRRLTVPVDDDLAVSDDPT